MSQKLNNALDILAKASTLFAIIVSAGKQVLALLRTRPASGARLLTGAHSVLY